MHHATRVGIEHTKMLGRTQVSHAEQRRRFNKGNTIFIIEDDVEILATFSRMLANASFRVSSSQLAEHALSALTSKHPIDLIIADLVLPGMDGEEFCNRAAQLRPGMPFIIMTGSDTVIDLAKFPPNTSAIYKPLRRQDVLELIEIKLGQRAPGRIVVG